jgi:hypothetical protein
MERQATMAASTTSWRLEQGMLLQILPHIVSTKMKIARINLACVAKVEEEEMPRWGKVSALAAVPLLFITRSSLCK